MRAPGPRPGSRSSGHRPEPRRASILNIAYNDVAVISRHEGAEAMFHVLLPIINMVMFPIAIVLVLWRSSAVLTAVRNFETSPPTAENRRQALRIPIDAAGIGVGCWLFAGLLWPVVLNCCVALTVDDYLQFLASLVMCGVMSAVHTFFVTTVFAVRVLLPAPMWRKPVSRRSAAARRLRSQAERVSGARLRGAVSGDRAHHRVPGADAGWALRDALAERGGTLRGALHAGARSLASSRHRDAGVGARSGLTVESRCVPAGLFGGGLLFHPGGMAASRRPGQ